MRLTRIILILMCNITNIMVYEYNNSGLGI